MFVHSRFIYCFQATELTGRSADDAMTALHDCDYDLNRAVEQLLDLENDQVKLLCFMFRWNISVRYLKYLCPYIYTSIQGNAGFFVKVTGAFVFGALI